MAHGGCLLNRRGKWNGGVVGKTMHQIQPVGEKRGGGKCQADEGRDQNVRRTETGKIHFPFSMTNV